MYSPCAAAKCGNAAEDGSPDAAAHSQALLAGDTSSHFAAVKANRCVDWSATEAGILTEDLDNTATMAHSSEEAEISQKEAHSSSQTLSVLIPTAFTTAAGRRICVCEQRTLEKDSPHWRLLYADSSIAKKTRDELVAAAATSAGDHHGDVLDGTFPEEDAEGSTDGHGWRRRPGEWCSEFPLPFHAPRSTSCPQRFQSHRATDAGEGLGGLPQTQQQMFTYNFSGFVRADGRMIYLSNPSPNNA